LKSAQGINLAVEKIQAAILSISKKTKNKLFVLALDEFDVLFYDRRGRPSDFIYKLLVMEEKLREQGYLVSVIAISNNIMSDYEIDDRVRSRIGSSEIFFGAYTKKDVLAILNDRAATAFSKPVEPTVLEFCAEMSSAEHGDARRAIDLLRVAAEIASSKSEAIEKKHVDIAAEQLQKDRVSLVLSTASYHFRLAAGAIAKNTYMTAEAWHSTSMVYDRYCELVQKEMRPLTYRRVSELLTELENTGLAVSQTSSKGRHGYGTQYRLTVSPDIVGRAVSKEWWDGVVASKKAADSLEELQKTFHGMSRRRSRFSLL
jgi:cell division control protein 6